MGDRKVTGEMRWVVGFHKGLMRKVGEACECVYERALKGRKRRGRGGKARGGAQRVNHYLLDYGIVRMRGFDDACNSGWHSIMANLVNHVNPGSDIVQVGAGNVRISSYACSRHGSAQRC
jgi:hypothetical protein